MRGLLVGSILGAAGQTVVQGGSLVAIIVGLLGGTVFAAGISAWRFRKLGQAEKESMITEAAQRAVKSMKDALEQREKDLKDALGRVEALEKRVEKLNEQIVELKDSLETANGERATVQALLDATIRERDGLTQEIAQLRAQVNRIDPTVPD